jgi:hypothetical protein
MTSTMLALIVSSIQKKITSKEVLNTIKTETAKQFTDGIKKFGSMYHFRMLV